MEIITEESYQLLSQRAAHDLIALLAGKKNPLICLASGASPEGLYRELVFMVQKEALDISDWYFVGLDEWMGMNGSDEGSCRWHLDRQFFQPLHIQPEQICFFDGRAADPPAECVRTEQFIRDHNGIDLAIVGIGMNGHIGMNEPGTPASLSTHIADIALQTQQVGQKYFTSPRKLDQGITLGMANITESGNIMLMVSGRAKANILKAMMTQAVTEQLPATLLKKHSELRIYADKDAASLLPNG